MVFHIWPGWGLGLVPPSQAHWHRSPRGNKSRGSVVSPHHVDVLPGIGSGGGDDDDDEQRLLLVSVSVLSVASLSLH
jgi:hypothetical protein